jgi:chaperonin GroES
MTELNKLLKMDNIAEDLDEDTLLKIGQRVKAGFDEDLNSSQEWMNDVKKVMELASLTATKKTTPLPDSANIKFPIIIKAAYEFSSRAYPEMVKDGQVVKTRIIGKDITGEKAKQAKRVADYMNYQLLFVNEEWEQELNKLLTMLALIGFVCKKTYYDPVREQVKSEICEYQDLIINAKAKNLNEASRISHVLHISLNDAIEQVRSGLYLEDPIKELINQTAKEEQRPDVDVIEQHCFLDLDDDDYEEPYVVTIIKDSGKVVRIAARFFEEDIKRKKGKVQYINAIQYFTDYHFLVSPKGKFQGVGFGILMMHLNASINSILNMITDAGQLANLQAGYIDSRAKVIESGSSLHDPGELKKVKTMNGLALKDAVHIVDFKEPSSVLYQTLGLLISTARDLSSSNEVMTGSSGTENTKTGAVLALQEEGRKVITGINKGVYRSQSSEFNKIFRLNQLYLDPQVYVEVLDDDLAVSNKDFDSTTVNVIPVADPNLASESTRMVQAQFLANTMQFPGVKPEKITRRIYNSANIENAEELLLSDEEMEEAKKQPNPDIIKLQSEIEHKAQQLNIEGRRLDMEEKRLQLDMIQAQADVIKTQTESMLNIAKAEAAEAGSQLQSYNAQLNTLSRHLDVMMGDRQLSQAQQHHDDEMSMRQQEAQANAQQAPSVAPGPSDPGLG